MEPLEQDCWMVLEEEEEQDLNRRLNLGDGAQKDEGEGHEWIDMLRQGQYHPPRMDRLPHKSAIPPH